MLGELDMDQSKSSDNHEAHEDVEASTEAAKDAELVKNPESIQSKKDAELVKNPESIQSKKDAELVKNPESIQSEKTPYVEATEEEKESTKKVLSERPEPEKEKSEINEGSEYSNEVNEMISSKKELEVYQKADLKEECIDGRTCLIRENIDFDYVDPKTGMTNRELMERGRAPYDAKTGERIELHHVGQEYDSPFAELTADSEHGRFFSVLHTKESESWRNDELKNNRYNNVDRPQHWKFRAKERL